MFSRRVGNTPSWFARHCFSLALGGLLLASAAPAWAQTPPISLGGGLRASFVHDSPDEVDGVTSINLESARLYINGPVTERITFMFNTEYDGGSNHVGILDAVARIAFSPKANIWMGRFLAPSDRANMYGPYYAHHWSVFTDGIQDGYPFVSAGRSNGVMWWGQFGKVKLSAGGFDGESATGNTDLLGAARVQVNFWDPEDGYYLNGTYYGAKNLLTVGAAIQAQSGNTASNVDFLLERKLGDGGSFTIESQYNNYDQLGGYNSNYQNSDGAYILGSYLFAKPVGAGRIELLGKYASASFTKGLSALDDDYDQKTTEINVNYLIKEFNARVMFFFKNTSFSDVFNDFKQVGVGLQIQM